jgi:hypothetical protein
MIIKIGLAKLGIGSNSGCHYDNSRHHPLDIFVEWNGTMFFVVFV